MPKVDAKGRVVLPQAIRDRLDIAPGTEVEVREEDGEVVIRPEDDPDRIVERLERLVEETASRPEATAPLGDEGDPDPIARRHRDAIRRGAETGGAAETAETEPEDDSAERDGTDE
ncbi:AbrB/MazE/SpoVT family DNA-binding domain-containing protein [Halorubrum sp. GN11_10-6_MGM]|uniref:AbrB/MazE/SpoVT family DNA-binding domain-containing protein n=1 Tax=Halorubrum sp. GN11_10-6_MGM TaxID=2518112 RepID=UPI0010F52FB2|nr:AbrB/MazE/SpoVT family DNA-binding domain-containing protein [Halorubrum sp. GN11_10-6_MGM]TKX74317.1 AbrB/MazE/SpoVT family DNA-binding domain-containing protein [Halorubrum sp. GN11_10-6_MGM]